MLTEDSRQPQSPFITEVNATFVGHASVTVYTNDGTTYTGRPACSDDDYVKIDKITEIPKPSKPGGVYDSKVREIDIPTRNVTKVVGECCNLEVSAADYESGNPGIAT